MLSEWLIQPEDLQKSLGKVVLVDIREPEERAEGHIPQDRFIPMGDIPSVGMRELDPDSDIVLYCAHGVRSMHALFFLRRQGFEKVRSLDGGIVAWTDSGLQTQQSA